VRRLAKPAFSIKRIARRETRVRAVDARPHYRAPLLFVRSAASKKKYININQEFG